jgi:hypothetical protein
MVARWASACGLAWAPSGKEVWFTATDSGFTCSLLAVNLSKNVRSVLTAPGTLTLHDISPEGRVLITRDALRSGAIGRARASKISWQDWTIPIDISDDGKIFVFSETGEAGGGSYAVYLRGTNGAPAALLGKGSAKSLSPDGQWVLSFLQDAIPPELVLLPTGVGQQRSRSTGDILPNRGLFMPDSKHVIFEGTEHDKGSRLYELL